MQCTPHDIYHKPLYQYTFYIHLIVFNTRVSTCVKLQRSFRFYFYRHIHVKIQTDWQTNRQIQVYSKFYLQGYDSNLRITSCEWWKPFICAAGFSMISSLEEWPFTTGVASPWPLLEGLLHASAASDNFRTLNLSASKKLHMQHANYRYDMGIFFLNHYFQVWLFGIILLNAYTNVFYSCTRQILLLFAAFQIHKSLPC